ncbi:MAG: BTAD domain-containing putative transcriptional regulator [Streptosporangiaceae bacterium]
MELRILGPFDVIDDNGRAVDVGGLRPQALLVALALADGHPVPADQLLDQVWAGEKFPDRNRLQVHVSRLRRVLGSDYIVTRGGGYALEVPAGAVDAVRFEDLAARGRAALHRRDAPAAARLLRQALGLWRGEPLAEFADSEFAAAATARLGEARLAAIEDRVEADLMLGAHGELSGELEALLQGHPLRERLWGQLMVALYRSGRQGDALGAYQRARGVLAGELGIDPGPELRRLETAVLAQDPQLEPPAAAGAARRRGNLPAAATDLIGRQADLDAVASLLQAGRLVTITGVGGVGKTRLAVEAARRLAGGYRDGAWLAELAPAGDDAGVAGAVAAALSVTPEAGPGAGAMLQRLGEFLSGRQVLLVLDNCEHVIDGAARMADYLLSRCPELTILATSRELVAVAGESLWPLAPLAMPDAIKLFAARARAAAPGFLCDEQAMTDVAEICARLDGLPLAIELAAARMRALAPGDVLARLGNRFRLFSGGSRTAPQRHQTLRAVIDWSYDLLFDDERRVFERMSVFAGPCPLTAAEQVCADGPVSEPDIADLLARLVDKSLVAVDQTERGGRFRVLQTLAEYGRERLVASGDLAATRARHARWVVSFVDVPDSEHGASWFAGVGEFTGEIRRAMEWALGSADQSTALAIVTGLGWFWSMGGVVDDCWQWFTASLALGQPATAQRVRALAFCGQLAVAQGREDALDYGAAAVELGRAVGDRRALAFAAGLHGAVLAGITGQRQRAVALIEQACELGEAEGDGWSLATATIARGIMALARGDHDRAEGLLRRAADSFAEMGNARSAAVALRHLAELAVIRDRLGDAIAALREAVTALAADNAAGIATMAKLACLCAAQGCGEEADRWLECALAAAEDQQHLPLLALALNAKGLVLRQRGHLEESWRCHRQALELYERRGLPSGVALAHASLGYIAELRHDPADAEQHHRASLDAAGGAADPQALALALEGLAGAASLRNDSDATGKLLGAAAGLRHRAIGAVVGAATAMRGVGFGRLERMDTGEAIARLEDRAAFDAAFAGGLRDPEGVLQAVRS